MNDLFQGEWGLNEYLIVGAVAFLIVVILLALFIPKNKKTTHTAVKTEAELKQSSAKNEVKSTPKEEVKVEPVKEEKNETVEEEIEETDSSLSTEQKPKAKKATASKATDGEAKKKVAKYHISQNKDDEHENAGWWRVRKEGSTKTIKYFKTQKEAIAYAEKLAENQDSSIVIHKKDGSIRKQDYSKKE